MIGDMRMMKFCYAKKAAGHAGSYSQSDFVVGQKVWATYNVTVLVQIGLTWG
jgi:hypothetical protein